MARSSSTMRAGTPWPSIAKKPISRQAASIAAATRRRSAAPVRAGARSMTGTLTASTSESRLVDRQPEPVPADHLVVGQPSLQVLGDHVEVLEVGLAEASVA